MMPDNHINDQELLRQADGETSASRAAEIRTHLATCWSCRARQADLERAIADFVHIHQTAFEKDLPPIDAARRMLRARLAQAAADPQPRLHQPRFVWAAAAVFLVVLSGTLWLPFAAHPAQFAPNAASTPGAVRLVDRDVVCSGAGIAATRAISASTAQAVFRRYGIRNPRPRSYEVDYLIPPALGGSDDINNLWPEPYSTGVWNSRVKDALEDHLRTLVCSGQLDLATAQRDLSRDWIAAYKKYFHTDRPLVDHVAFVKDRAWE
jgi:hypothetical protein